jgi:hypothetical protein
VNRAEAPRPDESSARRSDDATSPKGALARRIDDATSPKRSPQPSEASPTSETKKGPFLSEWALGSASVRTVWSRTDTQGRMGPHLRPCCEPNDKLAKNTKSTIEPTPFSDSCVRPSVWVA